MSKTQSTIGNDMLASSSHPDNPTNIEAANEAFQEAIRIAKGGDNYAPPWNPNLSRSDAIDELLRQSRSALLDAVPQEYSD